MKNILLAATIAVLSVMSVNAQSFGIKGGYNYANFTGEKADKFDLKGYSGFYAGAFVELPLSDIFAIQPEVIYSRQGSKLEMSKLTSTLAMDYITVPVFAKINLTEMISVQGGPQFGFLVNSPEFEVATNLVNGKEKISKDAFGTFDFAAGIGVSVNLPMGVLIEARYTKGFTNVFNDDNDSLKNSNIGQNTDFNNSVLSIGVGVKL